jgi:hypothetical protein
MDGHLRELSHVMRVNGEVRTYTNIPHDELIHVLQLRLAAEGTAPVPALPAAAH